MGGIGEMCCLHNQLSTSMLSPVWQRAALFTARPLFAVPGRARFSVSTQVDTLDGLSDSATSHQFSVSINALEEKVERPSFSPSGKPMTEAMTPSARPLYALHCQATPNNTIITFADPAGHVVGKLSGGSVGMRRNLSGSYEAGYTCATSIFKTIAQKHTEEDFNIHLVFKGFGQGRDAMAKALMTAEGKEVKDLITRITDKTPIKVGGTRAKKQRRL
jgi:small subunit ribosomal protein S11